MDKLSYIFGRNRVVSNRLDVFLTQNSWGDTYFECLVEKQEVPNFKSNIGFSLSVTYERRNDYVWEEIGKQTYFYVKTTKHNGIEYMVYKAPMAWEVVEKSGDIRLSFSYSAHNLSTNTVIFNRTNATQIIKEVTHVSDTNPIPTDTALVDFYAAIIQKIRDDLSELGGEYDNILQNKLDSINEIYGTYNDITNRVNANITANNIPYNDVDTVLDKLDDIDTRDSLQDEEILNTLVLSKGYTDDVAQVLQQQIDTIKDQENAREFFKGFFQQATRLPQVYNPETQDPRRNDFAYVITDDTERPDINKDRTIWRVGETQRSGYDIPIIGAPNPLWWENTLEPYPSEAEQVDQKIAAQKEIDDTEYLHNTIKESTKLGDLFSVDKEGVYFFDSTAQNSPKMITNETYTDAALIVSIKNSVRHLTAFAKNYKWDATYNGTVWGQWNTQLNSDLLTSDGTIDKTVNQTTGEVQLSISGAIGGVNGVRFIDVFNEDWIHVAPTAEDEEYWYVTFDNVTEIHLDNIAFAGFRENISQNEKDAYEIVHSFSFDSDNNYVAVTFRSGIPHVGQAVFIGGYAGNSVNRVNGLVADEQGNISLNASEVPTSDLSNVQAKIDEFSAFMLDLETNGIILD